jgi:hypothetical protein
MNKNRRVKGINIKASKEVKDRIRKMIYEQMYKEFETICAFNRIQYSINSISKNTISK